MNHNPTKEERQYVRQSLVNFNIEHVGEDAFTPLSLVEYDGDGNVIGGLLGGTYWGWLYVDILWVQEEYRGKGIGSALLLTAEREAVKRGCHHAHLETMSWQAPEFYKKYGYEIIGALPDIPTGHKKFLLTKSLQNSEG